MSENIDDETREALRRLIKIIDAFRSLGPQRLNVSQVRVFLLVAENPELNVSGVAERLGMKVSTVSKHLRDLGKPRHAKDRALGLLVRGIDPENPRSARFDLSDKGRSLVRRLRSA